MPTINYLIDDTPHSVEVPTELEFQHGDDQILADRSSDITYDQLWYDTGYCEADFLNETDFADLRQGLNQSIEALIKKTLGINTEGFDLERYHHYVRDDESHFKIVSKTRDLFAADFNFPVMTLLDRISAIMGFELSDINPTTGDKHHIIVRINRPGSNDYNPPHKDTYEGVDKEGYIPLFMNTWIPVAGVTPRTALPIVPASHRLNEQSIVRTFTGAHMQGNQYRVRMIRSWGDDNNQQLYRSQVSYGQALIFSSHLIHGLGVNKEPDTTRVALEFRLYPAQN